MIEAEKRMVAELVKDKRLGQDAYLLKDGSLEYKVMKSGREDLRTLQKIKHKIFVEIFAKEFVKLLRFHFGKRPA